MIIALPGLSTLPAMGRRFAVWMIAALALADAATAADGVPLPAVLQRLLIESYPATITRGGGDSIIVAGRTTIPIDPVDPARRRPHVLAAPTVSEMFIDAYRPGRQSGSPPRAFDPGRARNSDFFDAMYGNCAKGDVEKNLVEIVWLPGKSGERLRITRINGVAAKLAAVSAELDRLPARFDAYLKPSAGTYNCRSVAGTERASAHGWGIAIDIATRHAHYWRWQAGKAPAEGAAFAYRNEIPWEIVEIFERHGFIWGGKWYHYDTMHFEYRPELIAAGRTR
jgi:hypothetical protein